MANIILPQVNILNEINDSATMLVEQNGEINRFNIADLDIGGGDVTINLEDSNISKPNPVNADTLGGYPANDYATKEQLEDAVLKSQVVNNFTTTEEGFVADARTVKLLNDEIKGNTTPIKLSDLTLNEKISISSWSYSKVGKLCGFYAIITANQAISAEEMLFYGMDKPIFVWDFNSRYFEYVLTLKPMYIAERYSSGAVITRENIEAGQQWIVYDLFITA